MMVASVVKAAPVASFTVSNTVVCIGQSITITSTATGSITSYTWNFGSGAVPLSATTLGPHSISYSTPGLKTISLTVTGPDGTSTETQTDIIQVNAVPATPAIITGPESVCSGATAVSYSVQPVTYASNAMFQIKMVLIVFAGLNALVYYWLLHPLVHNWTGNTEAPLAARIVAYVSLALWTSVMLCGRLIPYIGEYLGTGN